MSEIVMYDKGMEVSKIIQIIGDEIVIFNEKLEVEKIIQGGLKYNG